MTSFVLTDGRILQGEEPLDPIETAKCLADENGYIGFTEVGTGDVISIASRNVLYIAHHK